MLKNLVVILSSVMALASGVQAEVSYSMPSIEVGLKLNSADLKNASSNKQTQAFQAGGSTVLNLSSEGAFGVKLGLMYSERAFEAEYPTNTVKGKITYAEVPVHFMYKLEDYVGLYAGPSVAMKMGDSCTNCNLTDIKSMIVPITVGAQFKFAPTFGLNLFLKLLEL